MSTARPFDAARADRAAPAGRFGTLSQRRAAWPNRFVALPHSAAAPRLPAKPRLNALDPSLWWVHALRRTVWRWQRCRSPRATAALVWC